MPILRDFERRLGDMVEGFFATTFRSGLQPVELAKRLLREMDAHKTVGVRDVWAPNRFVFGLSPADGERFERAEGALIAELQQVVRDAASERGWGLLGPPEIEFEIDDQLGVGRLACAASFAEGPDGQPSTRPGSARISFVDVDGVQHTYRLDRDVTVLGRLPESDLQVNDPGASRQHARIERRDGGFVLLDLGSTNGTLVNDELTPERRLDDGDRITIGNTVLEFRSG